MNSSRKDSLLQVHPAMQHFCTEGNDLQVAGQSVRHWVETVGSTPVYLYDRSVVQTQVERLRHYLPAGIKLSYAVKANPFPPLVESISKWVDGFDVASQKELELVLVQGVRPDQVSFAGPGKSVESLKSAIKSGVIINLESATEIERCVQLARELGKKPRVCIRVNPGLDVRASGMKMSSSEGSPFGIDFEQVADVLQNFPVDTLELLGFHVYGCSQQLDAQRLLIYLAAVLEQLKTLQSLFPGSMRQINLGGGFGIPYFPKDQPLDLAAVGQGLSELFLQHRAWLEGLEVKMEFGRFLVGEAGVYVCRVVDIKESGGKRFAIVDGGMHHHLANAGLLGQVVRRNYPVAVANKMDQPLTSAINICGPLCTPLDRVATQVELPELEIGDIITIFSSGAYGLTASPTGFLSQPLATEILCQ